MSARRQPSTTSLSKFERTNSPGTQNRSFDFCNSFWGLGDGGVDVLFARMRGAARTMEELRNYWKERAAIEEEYAKRMSKLSKMTLGRDEIGELRNSLDTIRLETDRQATFHLDLSQQIRTELEAQAASFYARQMHHKKIHQSAIEKQFKAKQTQETYVNRAREKYEADCVRINSYTAQSSLVQGKDLEKVTLKLERAQQTVQANERDFANFAKALQDTTLKWEADWKSFTDSCQDLEEYRLEFIKDNLWTYANAVSSVCVADDEACEKMRVALEQMEPEKEMANFVRDYGTGNQIPDPPAFVNYNTTEAIPSRPTSRPAQFQRATQRDIVRQPAPVSGDEDSGVNAAGVGAGGGARRTDSQIDAAPLTRRATQSQARASMYGQQNGIQSNGHVSQNSSTGPSPGPGSSQPMQRRPTVTAQTPPLSRVPPDPHAEVIDPNVPTYIKVGNNAYPVDLSNDPQQNNGASSRQQTSSPTKRQSGSIDPLAKHMEDLQNSISNSGPVRKNPTQRQSLVPEARPQSSSRGGSSLSPPSQNSALVGASGSPAQAKDYRNSAELVVGAHPSSRPASPSAITAAFMVPKPSVSPSGSEVVNEVLQDYQQSLPGERKSTSRRGSFVGPQSSSPVNGNANGRPTHNPSMSQGQNLARPVSQLGHAGIGAHGSRSNSPQPISRVPSPAPNSARNTLIAPPPAQPTMARAPSPNTVGIALDPSGRVLHDDMAQIYHQQQQQQQQQQQLQQQRPTQQQPPPPPQIQPQQQQVQQQRRLSYNAIQAPPPPAAYGMTPPPPNPYSAQPAYAQPPTTQPPYSQNNMYYSQPPQQQPVYQQSQAGYAAVGGVQRASGPVSGSYFQGTPSQQLVLQQQQPQRMSYQNTYQDPSPARRSPSPQPGMPPPTGQTTEEGAGILFYVKALYDYTATIDEEFDFQAGDIIAVTATPEDGWWSGELLDEQRRQKGRHVFPSNFVCLF